jgi:hypothetical protein
MRTPRPFLQPCVVHEVHEFPVSYFGDWPGHYRHAQVCACSAPELEAALMQAWRSGWYSFVIVAHSFELIKRHPWSTKPARPDRFVIRRFERLCRFLARHRDKFRTAHFRDLDPAEIPTLAPERPLHSGGRRAAMRVAEQLARRIFV